MNRFLYPSADREELVKKLVTFVAYAYPLTAIPQIYTIWVEKNVSGVSLLTWFGFLLMTVPLLLYSIQIKERKLTIMYSLWSLAYILVIAGLLLVA